MPLWWVRPPYTFLQIAGIAMTLPKAVAIPCKTMRPIIVQIRKHLEAQILIGLPSVIYSQTSYVLNKLSVKIICGL